ncbi:DUF5966 family protein [Streptococcus merionis]|uniref:DUF5966 family protein n=1 Tax=Streptococcus merionis TaxID=400065 RepID=UPI0035172872
MMEQVLQGLVFIAGLGMIFLILYKLLKLTAGLALIGVIGGLVFVEVYGIYLFFTERYLYTEDLATNGLFSFTGCYIAFNGFLLFVILRKIIKNRLA